MKTEFVAANGLVFEVAQCEAEQEGGGDRLALCLHGFPELNVSWRHQMPFLASLGYRVWAPNLRGYGATSRPSKMSNYAIEHLMADIAGLIDASGAKSVTLIGHDWGGLVAWFFAMRRIRPLERLIQLNIPHPACFRRELRHWRQMRRSWYVALFQIPWLPDYLFRRKRARMVAAAFRENTRVPEKFTREILEPYRQAALQPGATTAMLNWYRAAVRGGGLNRQYRAGFPVIETPTLIVWGEDDFALDISTLDETETYVSDLTIERLPGVSHWVQQEAPEAVNAAIARFLKR